MSKYLNNIWNHLTSKNILVQKVIEIWYSNIHNEIWIRFKDFNNINLNDKEVYANIPDHCI